MENWKTTKNSIKKEIYTNIQKYFESISLEDLKQSKWKVPIGG